MKKEKNGILYNKEWKERISFLENDKFWFNNKIQEKKLKDVIIEMKFKLHQHGLHPMIFNADNEGNQKTQDKNIYISHYCLSREMFDQNPILMNVSSLVEKSNLLRGGVYMEKKGEKDKNCCLKKCINYEAVASPENFKKLKMDLTGTKAKGENYDEGYMVTKEGYLNATFDCKIRFYLKDYLYNVEGHNFAQENALKVIDDNELSKYIDDLFPIKDDILNVDFLVEIIKDKIRNLKYYSKRGDNADFKITDFECYMVPDDACWMEF